MALLISAGDAPRKTAAIFPPPHRERDAIDELLEMRTGGRYRRETLTVHPGSDVQPPHVLNEPANIWRDSTAAYKSIPARDHLAGHQSNNTMR